METGEDFTDAAEQFKKMTGNRNKFIKGSPIQTLNFANFKTPVFKEKSYKDWIMLAGGETDNSYCDYLVRLAQNCSIHGAIIDSTIKQVTGEGFQIQDTDDLIQKEKLTKFLKQVNIKKTLEGLATDYVTFGYAFIGIKWAADRQSIKSLYHVDATTIRCGKPDENREIKFMYYSENWSKYREKNFEPEAIPIFSLIDRVEPTCILMIKKYQPGVRFYAQPYYSGALQAVNINISVLGYILSSIKNGFSPSMIINFNNGVPSEEMRETISRSMDQLYKGEGNAGRPILSFNDSTANAVSVQEINTGNMSEIYASLADLCTNEIVRGHKLNDPSLAGVSIPGQLGKNNDLKQASQIYTSQVIYPMQIIIEDCINELLEINDYTLKLRIKDTNPISFTFADATLMSIMKINEMRQMVDLLPIEKNDYADITTIVVESGKLAVGGEPVKKEKQVEKASADVSSLPPYVDEGVNKKKRASFNITESLDKFKNGK